MSHSICYCGVDLAKHHFSLHATDERGTVLLHKSVSRAKLLTTIANMPPMRIGIEACSGARTVIANIGEKQDRLSAWGRNILERRGMNRAIFALAAKNARIIWAMLHNQSDYQDDAVN